MNRGELEVDQAIPKVPGQGLAGRRELPPELLQEGFFGFLRALQVGGIEDLVEGLLHPPLALPGPLLQDLSGLLDNVPFKRHLILRDKPTHSFTTPKGPTGPP